jgi:hypothetical protein
VADQPAGHGHHHDVDQQPAQLPPSPPGDSKDPNGPALVLAPEAFAAFTSAIKTASR